MSSTTCSSRVMEEVLKVGGFATKANSIDVVDGTITTEQLAVRDFLLSFCDSLNNEVNSKDVLPKKLQTPFLKELNKLRHHIEDIRSIKLFAERQKNAFSILYVYSLPFGEKLKNEIFDYQCTESYRNTIRSLAA